MIILIHQKAKKVITVLQNNVEISFPELSLNELVWWLAERNPDELIGWCDEKYHKYLNLEEWAKVFHHNLIMASYAINTTFLPATIGYIDPLPFVTISEEVNYPTWLMSSDVGGIRGESLLRFKELFFFEQNFLMLINSIAKLGQQNGLFCYSSPILLKTSAKPIFAISSTTEVFRFVYTHYKTVRLIVLFWCYFKYENKFPLFALISGFFSSKLFRKKVNLTGINTCSTRFSHDFKTIDVIIPTMGRRKYLLQVMEDLRNQTVLPQKVIVVEQNPVRDAVTDLPELRSDEWPFEIIHEFIHKTGACNARNLALENTTADWVFFADDDNRMPEDLLERALEQIRKYGADVLTLNYLQEGEKVVFEKVKQWGTFGAGNSIVTGGSARKIKFDPIFEHGYGEDQDYGIQLRNAGCDIIYHPEIKILHLKAPIGGFREVRDQPWEMDNPKPSPTLMAYIKKNYTEEQIKGYKIELLLRFYSKQNIRNPWNYFKSMKRRWAKSEQWAEKLCLYSRNSR